jgi:hypothetical protein
MVQALALLAALTYLLTNGLARFAQRIIDPRLTASLTDFS